MKVWLEDLVDEYPTKRTAKAITRLARVFAEYDDSVMRKAVDKYLLNEQYFPKVANLRPYVDEAFEDSRGPVPFDDGGQKFTVTDHDLYAMEVERGTMPPPDALYEYEFVGEIIDGNSLEVFAELPY